MLALLSPLADTQNGCGEPSTVNGPPTPASQQPPSGQLGPHDPIQTPFGPTVACAYWLFYNWRRTLVQQGQPGEFYCSSDDHASVGSQAFGFYAITDAEPDSLILHWRGPPSDVPAIVVGFRIDRSDEGGSWHTVFGGNAPCGTIGAYRDIGLVPGATYYYRVGDYVIESGTQCSFQLDDNVIGASAHG